MVVRIIRCDVERAIYNYIYSYIVRWNSCISSGHGVTVTIATHADSCEVK